MGKSSPNKKKSDATSAGPIEPFLRGSRPCEPMEIPDNMAPDDDAGKPQRDRITKQDLLMVLADQRQNILESISQILSPLKEQIDVLHKDIQQIAQTADAALKASIASNEDIRQLQSHERWAKEEIITLKFKLRDKNIKLRGLAEKAEGNLELPVFLANWLASCLQLEEGITPLILRAYRVGNAMSWKVKGPCDVIIEFADLRTKKAVMNAAKQGGGLKFNDAMIQWFPDLPPETLQQKKLLRPFSQRLMDADIRYR